MVLVFHTCLTHVLGVEYTQNVLQHLPRTTVSPRWKDWKQNIYMAVIARINTVSQELHSPVQF